MTEPAQTFKATLDDQGVSLVEWAREHGFKIRTVRAVLYGELQGKRGISHKIAVAMGLKAHGKKDA